MAWTKEIPKTPGFYWYRDNRPRSLGEMGILQLTEGGDWWRFASDETVHFGPVHPNVAHIFKGHEPFNPDFWNEPLFPPRSKLAAEIDTDAPCTHRINIIAIVEHPAGDLRRVSLAAKCRQCGQEFMFLDEPAFSDDRRMLMAWIVEREK